MRALTDSNPPTQGDVVLMIDKKGAAPTEEALAAQLSGPEVSAATAPQPPPPSPNKHKQALTHHDSSPSLLFASSLSPSLPLSLHLSISLLCVSPPMAAAGESSRSEDQAKRNVGGGGIDCYIRTQSPP